MANMIHDSYTKKKQLFVFYTLTFPSSMFLCNLTKLSSTICQSHLPQRMALEL